LENPGKDVMLLATLELELKVDKTLCLAFGARIVIVGEGDSARMQSCVVFTDSAPLKEALAPQKQ